MNRFLALSVAKQTIIYVRHVRIALSVAKPTIREVGHAHIDLVLTIIEKLTRAPRAVLFGSSDWLQQLDKYVKPHKTRKVRISPVALLTSINGWYENDVAVTLM